MNRGNRLRHIVAETGAVIHSLVIQSMRSIDGIDTQVRSRTNHLILLIITLYQLDSILIGCKKLLI